jgi:hypothetical protein
MNPPSILGILLMATGVILVVVGLVVMLAPKVPFLGKLPGDIVIERKNFTFYFPIVTSLILSAAFTVALWLISRFSGR